jgi:hypothetical protein
LSTRCHVQTIYRRYTILCVRLCVWVRFSVCIRLRVLTLQGSSLASVCVCVCVYVGVRVHYRGRSATFRGTSASIYHIMYKPLSIISCITNEQVRESIMCVCVCVCVCVCTWHSSAGSE